MSSLIDEARDALGAELGSDELGELIATIKARVSEAHGRWQAITKKDGSTFASLGGPERRRAIAAGDLDALKAMDEECAELEAELAVLRNYEGQLKTQFSLTLAREHAQAMPESYADIAQMLHEEARLKAEYREARQRLDAQLRELMHRRTNIAQASIHGASQDVPPADQGLLTRFMQVRGFSFHEGPSRVGWFSVYGGPRDLVNAANALGLAVPQRDCIAA